MSLMQHNLIMDIKNDYCSLYAHMYWWFINAICILAIDIQIISVLSPHKYVDPHVGYTRLSALSIHKYVDAQFRSSRINTLLASIGW